MDPVVLKLVVQLVDGLGKAVVRSGRTIGDVACSLSCSQRAFASNSPEGRNWVRIGANSVIGRVRSPLQSSASHADRRCRAGAKERKAEQEPAPRKYPGKCLR